MADWHTVLDRFWLTGYVPLTCGDKVPCESDDGLLSEVLIFQNLAFVQHFNQ
jgi:hypothetical protein